MDLDLDVNYIKTVDNDVVNSAYANNILGNTIKRGERIRGRRK